MARESLSETRIGVAKRWLGWCEFVWFLWTAKETHGVAGSTKPQASEGAYKGISGVLDFAWQADRDRLFPVHQGDSHGHWHAAILTSSGNELGGRVNSQQKTLIVLATALLLTAGLVVAGQASSGDVAACIEKSGNLSVPDSNGDCAKKAEPITLASGGSTGSSMSFYVVEETYVAPTTIPEPAKPFPVPGLEENVVLSGGTQLASCSPGDVAVDGSYSYRRLHEDKDTGTRTQDSLNTVAGFVALPFAGSDTPSGYGLLRDLSLSHRWSNWAAANGVNYETKESFSVRVTCADVTP
jgi:hypothetical protein